MGGDALSAGVVARRLGVAVTTLRTWHRRYGLGPSEHVPGQHRRYTPADLARLEVMRRLTAQGVSPADAAGWARRAGATPGAATPGAGAPGTATVGAGATGAGAIGVGPTTDDRDNQPATPAQDDDNRPAISTRDTGNPLAAPARDGGGAIVGVGRAGPAARGLVRAAMRLDAAGMADTLQRSLAADGVVATWDGLLRPVLAGIGARHAATAGLIEVEHLVSRCVSEALASVPRPAAGDPARILLACADEEQHTLPLEALAAALAEAGVGCRLLGARVPVHALLAAVKRTGPAVVGLWSHAPATADPSQLDALLGGRHRPLLVLAAGPGWSAGTLPAGVVLPASLAEAVSLASTVVASTAVTTTPVPSTVTAPPVTEPRTTGRPTTT